MPELFVPESAAPEEEEVKLVVNYKPTQEDEEKFMLMYMMNIQPSEIDFDLKDKERRRWVLARFMMQKQSEREMVMQERQAMQLARGLDPSKLRNDG